MTSRDYKDRDKRLGTIVHDERIKSFTQSGKDYLETALDFVLGECIPRVERERRKLVSTIPMAYIQTVRGEIQEVRFFYTFEGSDKIRNKKYPFRKSYR
jgi:hypothetical protein